MLFTVILNYHDGLLLNCLRVVEETDCRPTDYLCYDFFGGKYCTSNSIPQGLVSAPFWPYQVPVQSEIRHTFSEMGY